jgi:hypothetical protein
MIHFTSSLPAGTLPLMQASNYRHSSS